MEANEAQELQEHAEHAEHEKTLRPVAFTMSLLAVLVAVTTVLGHRTHTEAVLDQNKATDMWGEYQAQKIRSYDTDLNINLMKVLPLTDKDAAKKDVDDYRKHQADWADKTAEEFKEAKALETDVKQAEARAVRFDLAEALLEIGLVITSVTLLTRSRAYWYLGIVFSAIGIASAVSVLFLK
jgi:hypothetical protein